MSDWGPGAWGLGRIKMRGGGGEGKRERGKEGVYMWDWCLVFDCTGIIARDGMGWDGITC